MRQHLRSSDDLELGTLTIEDAELLLLCLTGLRNLDSGRITPRTPLRLHFVEVCRGKATPETPYEIAYLRWRVQKPNLVDFISAKKDLELQGSRTARAKSRSQAQAVTSLTDTPPSRFLPLDKKSIQTDQQTLKERDARISSRSDLPKTEKKYKPRVIEETWGSREAWKRDKYLNKFNGR